MKAITLDGFGDVDRMSLSEVPTPTPGPGEVAIAVRAAALNRADLLQRQGFYPPPPGASDLLGLEVSGTICALGAGVTEWAVGDPCCALLAGGGYAEVVTVAAGQVLPIPAGVPLADAAALPEVACTVWSNLVDVAHLSAGDWLLVHGGSSGIGTMAIQVAKALGAHVAVTAGSTAKLAACADLGADIGINYRDQDFVEEVRAVTGGRGVDVLLDNMGAAYLGRNVAALATGGRLVVIGLQGGTRGELDLAALLGKRASVTATSLRARPTAEKAAIVAAVRAHVWPWVAAGAVRVVVHERYPLTTEGVRTAHTALLASHHVGKILLDVDQG